MFSSPPCIFLLCSVLCLILSVHATSGADPSGPFVGHLVKRDDRKSLISTEFGRVSGAKVTDGNETFLLHFITLEPNSLLLPVLLHQDMVFYVHTGSGRLSYEDDNKLATVDLRRGDMFRLESGTVFFIQSDLHPGRQKLRIHAIFGDAGEDLRDPNPYGPYSSIRDLVLGFDKRILQETFKVPEEVIEEIRRGPKPGAITRGIASTDKSKTKWEYEFTENVLISRSAYGIFDTSNKDRRKSNLYNFFHEKRDFENCNGWSTTVTKKKNSVLKDSKYGLFMVNLTRGGMMGPHWNPRATEIAVVLEGKGVVRVVCPSLVTDAECKNSRFAVEEGDIFVVPRFHPMAQLAFNNETFVFVGFSTSVKNNHPQYLAGKASVLRTLDKHILATSFGVNDTIFDKIVNQQGESVILECVSCAEEEYRIMSEEIQREREKAKEREEEEARRREEEKRKQEEESKKREEEEAKRREEEAARKKEEEERRKREQEAAARREREEEEAQRRREEEGKKQQQQEEQRREEEERKKQQQQEEQRREQEEREARQREEEEAQRRREEKGRKRQQQEEEERRTREQEAREAAAARKAEEEREAAARREEEAARRQEQEAQRRQQEAGEGGQHQGGREAQAPAPEEERRKEAEAQREEEAARQQEEETRREQEQGGGTGWARRIMKQRS